MGEYLRIQEMLKEGEAYAGLILGKDGETDYHLVLLPDDVSDVSWPTAREWAGSQEGDLPTRRELALLFANLRERFDRVWYWSNEQHDTRRSWCGDRTSPAASRPCTAAPSVATHARCGASAAAEPAAAASCEPLI